MRHTTGKAAFGKTLTLGVVVLAGCCLAGCGQKVEVPVKAPDAAQIKGYSDTQLEAVEQAIRKRDKKLPSRVKGLARHLRSLQISVAVGPGQKYQNSAEAIRALDDVITKLNDWFDRSVLRESGETDQDLGELQDIVDEAKEILAGVKVGK